MSHDDSQKQWNPWQLSLIVLLIVAICAVVAALWPKSLRTYIYDPEEMEEIYEPEVQGEDEQRDHSVP